ncbi:rhomboid family intramembrane serine protease [Planctomicrobium sp. SH661]|uniref:rhomboid family intramembrane serine protease n=1 Tax=Planctomicrobium sp. SH661 TaxID=3448124 RepID=UPI003F5BB677
MDLNTILIWTVAAACGLALLQLIGQKQAKRFAPLPASILLTLAICLYVLPERAGIVAGVLFFLLMLVPAWGGAMLNSLLLKRHFRTARILAQVLNFLRPDRESRQLPRVIHAMELIQKGEAERAVESLKQLVPSKTPLGRMAQVLITRQQGSWQDFLNWAHEPGNMNTVRSDPNLLDAYLQALGETGRRSELLRYTQQLEATPRAVPAGTLNLIRMKAAAFSGDDFIVAQIFTGPLREMPLDFKRYWRATALQVAGQSQLAAKDFEWLTQNSDSGIAISAKRRLEQPLPTLLERPLDTWEQLELQQISHSAEVDIQRTGLHFRQSRASWGTWSIALVLLLVFVAEIPGGSEDFENLERMGAMLIPPSPDGGEWWRMITAAFLHFGPIHLTMNLLGLLVLGRRVEMSWGSGLLIVTYLTAAVGSIGLAPYFIEPVPLLEQNVLVGASGGVMGLLGGLLIQSLIDLIRGRTLLGSREFMSLLVVVLIQMAFDANTPNVSSEAHLLGMTIGILCGAVWNLAWWAKSRVTRTA